MGLAQAATQAAVTSQLQARQTRVRAAVCQAAAAPGQPGRAGGETQRLRETPPSLLAAAAPQQGPAVHWREQPRRRSTEVGPAAGLVGVPWAFSERDVTRTAMRDGELGNSRCPHICRLVASNAAVQGPTAGIRRAAGGVRACERRQTEASSGDGPSKQRRRCAALEVDGAVRHQRRCSTCQLHVPQGHAGSRRRGAFPHRNCADCCSLLSPRQNCTRALLTLRPLRMPAAAVSERQPAGAVRLGRLHRWPRHTAGHTGLGCRHPAAVQFDGRPGGAVHRASGAAAEPGGCELDGLNAVRRSCGHQAPCSALQVPAVMDADSSGAQAAVQRVGIERSAESAVEGPNSVPDVRINSCVSTPRLHTPSREHRSGPNPRV